MRIIHSRFLIESGRITTGSALVWYLSLLHWKKYGHTTVLYCNNELLENEEFLEYHIEEMYDEICILETPTNININKLFFATPKILSLQAELHKNKSDFIITDTDFVPFVDITKELNSTDVFTTHEEYLSTYSHMNDLFVRDGYIFPDWITWSVPPANTSFMYCNNKEFLQEYVDFVLAYITDNHVDYDESFNCSCMNFAEQQLLSEYANYKKINMKYLRSKNEIDINKRFIHTSLCKEMEDNSKLSWNLHYLYLIYINFEDFFKTNILSNKQFSDLIKEFTKCNKKPDRPMAFFDYYH